MQYGFRKKSLVFFAKLNNLFHKVSTLIITWSNHWKIYLCFYFYYKNKNKQMSVFITLQEIKTSYCFVYINKLILFYSFIIRVFMSSFTFINICMGNWVVLSRYILVIFNLQWSVLINQLFRFK